VIRSLSARPSSDQGGGAKRLELEEKVAKASVEAAQQVLKLKTSAKAAAKIKTASRIASKAAEYAAKVANDVQSDSPLPLCNTSSIPIATQEKTNLLKWLRLHGKGDFQEKRDRQREVLHEWFKSLDNDGNGKVTMDELDDPFIFGRDIAGVKEFVRALHRRAVKAHEKATRRERKRQKAKEQYEAARGIALLTRVGSTGNLARTAGAKSLTAADSRKVEALKNTGQDVRTSLRILKRLKSDKSLNKLIKNEAASGGGSTADDHTDIMLTKVSPDADPKVAAAAEEGGVPESKAGQADKADSHVSARDNIAGVDFGDVENLAFYGRSDELGVDAEQTMQV
jgi:hypothetical protein